MKALVLSGGGAKGAYQVGVLTKWMGEQGTDYDIMCGVSVGALNVAGLGHVPLGQPKLAIETLRSFWLNDLKTSSVYKRWFPFGRLHSLWLKSVYDSRPLQKLVRSTYDATKIQSSGKRIAVGATCLDTGESRYALENEDNFVEWVIASASYPIFLLPVEINGQLWTDGGVRSVTPLAQAVHMGATEIDVIMCSNPWLQNTWSSDRLAAIPEQMIRVVDLMTDQIMRYDLQIVGLKNEEADLSERYRNVKIRLVMPSRELTSNSLEFNNEDTIRMMNIGYEDADKFLVYSLTYVS